MTVIIVEGLDRCGKSTQIKRLMRHFTDKPIQWLHYSSIPDLNPARQTAWFKKTFAHMFKLIKDDSAHWILDRSHIGEAVYQKLYRPTESHGYVWYLEGENLIAERDDIALIVLVDSSFEYLKRDDGDSYSTNQEMCKKELLNFKEAFKNTSIQRKVIIDIANLDVDQVTSTIDLFLEEAFHLSKH